jgi:hypothetical protein
MTENNYLNQWNLVGRGSTDKPSDRPRPPATVLPAVTVHPKPPQISFIPKPMGEKEEAKKIVPVRTPPFRPPRPAVQGNLPVRPMQLPPQHRQTPQPDTRRTTRESSTDGSANPLLGLGTVRSWLPKVSNPCAC